MNAITQTPAPVAATPAEEWRSVLSWRSIRAPEGIRRAEAAELFTGVAIISAITDRDDVFVFLREGDTGLWKELYSGFRDIYDAQEQIERELRELRACRSIAMLVESLRALWPATRSLCTEALIRAQALIQEDSRPVFPGAKELGERLRVLKIAVESGARS